VALPLTSIGIGRAGLDVDTGDGVTNQCAGSEAGQRALLQHLLILGVIQPKPDKVFSFAQGDSFLKCVSP